MANTCPSCWLARRVVEMSHAIGVSVEGELGCLGSLETGQAGEEDGIGAEGTLDHSQMLTDPDQAADFVRQTNVDALAIAIGTSVEVAVSVYGPVRNTTCAQRPSASSIIVAVPMVSPTYSGHSG